MLNWHPFDRFTDFADVSAHARLPDDWLVLCADVRGSTRALEEERYKYVNLIGAACITAVLKVPGDVEVPFVFGGDGAAIVVPPVLRAAAEAELAPSRSRYREIEGLIISWLRQSLIY